MNENVARALFEKLSKLEKMPTEKQLKTLWVLVIGLLADNQNITKVLEGKETENNFDLHYALQMELTKILTNK